MRIGAVIVLIAALRADAQVKLVITCHDPAPAVCIQARPDEVDIYDSDGLVQSVSWDANGLEWTVDFKNSESPCVNGRRFQKSSHLPCMIFPAFLPLQEYQYGASVGGFSVDPKIIHSGAVALSTRAAGARVLAAPRPARVGVPTAMAYCLVINAGTAAFLPNVASPRGENPQNLVVRTGDYITWKGSGVWTVALNRAGACKEGKTVSSSETGYCTADQPGRYSYSFTDGGLTKVSRKKKFHLRVNP